MIVYEVTKTSAEKKEAQKKRMSAYQTILEKARKEQKHAEC